MWQLLINTGLLLVVGIILGIERERSHKVIGVRSTLLILFGAFIFTYVSTKVGGDPARIIAQVVCGSGFIGAGMIFKAKPDEISNLTTAIFVWVLSGLGVMLALGLYEVMFFSIIIYLILKWKV
jgi:putative Mg2+ transporter-C (MgtC) family protein